jgi:hypothetical protein
MFHTGPWQKKLLREKQPDLKYTPQEKEAAETKVKLSCYQTYFPILDLDFALAKPTRV